MRVIEQFSAAKKGADNTNEDAIAVTANFVAVFDGSSLAKGEEFEFDGEIVTGGRFSSQILSKALENLDPELEAPDAVKTLTANFNNALLAQGKDAENTLAGSTAVIYSKNWNQVWMVGDGWTVIDGEAHTNELPPALIRAEIRKALVDIKIADAMVKGKSLEQAEEELLANDPTPLMIKKGMPLEEGKDIVARLPEDVQDRIKSWLVNVEVVKGNNKEEAEVKFNNLDSLAERISTGVMSESKVFSNSSNPAFGYGVINGRAVPENHIKVIELSDDVKEVTLASDGYPAIKPTVEKTEEYLGWVMNNDPLCYKQNIQVKAVNKGQIAYDDRSMIKFTL